MENERCRCQRVLKGKGKSQKVITLFLIVLLVNNSWFKSFSLFSCRKDSVYFNTISGKWEKSEVGGGKLRWGWRLFAWIVCAYSTKRCSFDAKFNRNTQINLTFASSACLGVLRRAKRPVGPSEEVKKLRRLLCYQKSEIITWSSWYCLNFLTP